MTPDSRTVHDAYARTAARFPERPFLQVLPETADVYGIEPRIWNYGELSERVERLAESYRRAGYGHGHRVGLLLENRPAFFVHWLALNRLGVSVVPISADWRAAELDYLVDHSEICFAVAYTGRGADLGRALAVIDAGDETPFPEPPFAAPLAGLRPDAGTECALLYTSGTTGRPKGCMLPNEYFIRSGQWYRGIGGLCAIGEGADRLITPLPMTHMNAMAFSTMVMMMTGGCVIALDRFHPQTWWRSVRDSGATIMHYLGVMPAMLLAAEAGETDRTHRLRFGFGAGVDRRHHAPFEQRFGVPLIEAWAMSETGAGAAIIANREPRHVGSACFGRPGPEVEWRIVADDGGDAPPGSPGELLVRSAGERPRAGFFAGYLKDAEASEAAWAGGYFHTGDVVRADADGALYFIDRKKNVIRRSGENISALEVEGVLLQHPLVAGAGVGAVPDPLRGEEVIACLVPRRPLAPTEQAQAAAQIVDFCLGQLAYYKVPGYVAFCEALPLTGTQKIQRAALRELTRVLPGSATCVDTRDLKKRRRHKRLQNP